MNRSSMLRNVLRSFFDRYPAFGWKYRHLFDRKWAEKYASTEALNHPHRDLIVQAMKRFEPFNDVLEIGCGAGANLLRIGLEYPEARLAGIDISSVAIEEARKLVKGQKHWFDNSDARDLALIRVHEFDVILSDAFLMYLAPAKFEKLVERMKEMARVGILMCEWHDPSGPFKDSNWVYDYEKYFPGCWLWPITEEIWPDDRWIKYGYLIGWNKPKTVLNSAA